MEPELIMVLVNAGLAILASVLGAKWGLGKGKITKAIGVAVALMDAIEDDKITPEEEKAIVAKIKALLPSEEG